MGLQVFLQLLAVVSVAVGKDIAFEDQFESTNNFILRQHYGCLVHSETIAKTTGARSAHDIVIISDTHTLLSCMDCVNPFPMVDINLTSFFWRFRGEDKYNFNDIEFADDEDTMEEAGRSGWVRDANGDVLIVGATQKQQGGDYLCIHRDTHHILNYWHVTVVEDRPYRVVSRNRQREFTGMEPLEPYVDQFYNIKVFTRWSVWTDCDRCGPRGSRFKMGYCTVVKDRQDVFYNDTMELSEMLSRFAEGIPCQSSRLPDYVRNIENVTNRPDEQIIEACLIKCPADEPQVEYYEEEGKYKTRYNPKGTFSFLHQRKQSVPPKVRRLTFELLVGTQVALVCPTYGKVGQFWRKDNTTMLRPLLLKSKFGRRVQMSFDHSILIKHVEMEDAGLYSCYNHDNFLLVTVDLHAHEPEYGAIFQSWAAMITFTILLSALSAFLMYSFCNTYIAPGEEANEGEDENENGEEEE